MFRSISRITAVLTLLLVPLAALAQTTASLSGTVTTDGAALPGVTVTISSPQMQGTRTTVTGDAGGYSFGSIPPGTYSVKFELSGLQTVTRNVQIGVGQSGRADASLKVASVNEAITVTAAAPSVLETPSVSSNLNQKLVNDLPTNRNVLAAASLAPGVNANTPSINQLSISGSPGYDNLIMVNGVSISEEVRSQALPLFIEDAVQETTVLTGGISAEYGRFTGGVVNSITKSGGNEFSGSFRDSLTNSAWSARTPLQEANGTKLTDKLNATYEATLGGYIVKDRLWFFTAGRAAKTDTDQATRIVPGDATRTSLQNTRVDDEKRYEGKLTAQLTAKHNITGSYLKVDSKSTGTRFTSASYDLESLTDRTDPQKLLSAHYNGVMTNNWLIEGQYSKMDWGVANGSGSKYTDVVLGTIVRNRADGNARYNSATFCGVCDKETRSNDGWNLKTNYFLSSKSLGNHSLVGGVETFAEHRFANNYQSGSNFRVFVNSVARISNDLYPTVNPGKTGGAALFQWTPIFTLQQNESNLATNSAFVNDKWDLNDHWSFNLGFRYDKNDATDASGNKVSKDSRLSPRLNATYDLAGNGRHRLTASYGQYVSRIVDGPGTSAASAGSPATIYFSYLGPAINPAGTPADQLVDTHKALQIMFDWFTHACNAQGKCGTENLDLVRNSGPFGGTNSIPGYTSRIGGSLSSPYVNEITFGYGTQWTPNLVTRVDLVSRDWKDFYAFRVDGSTPREADFLGLEHDVAIVQNTNDIQRKYRGIQFQGNWRPGRFNVGLNYTYSTLKGNDEQESANNGTVGNSPNSIFYNELTGFRQYQPDGYLLQDERHRARAWVGYDIPMARSLGALNVSLLQNFDSGTPYSAVQTIDVSPYADALLAHSTYVAAPTSIQYYFSKRGQYRLPDISATNLALNYRYPIGKVELFAHGDVFNVFNRNSLANVNTSVNTADTSANFLPFNPFTDTPKECPQGTPGAECKAMGANWQKGSSFGQAANASSLPVTGAGFQQTRTYRASVGVRF